MTSKRYFAVTTARVPELMARPDHTVYVQDDDGVGWAEASAERPITGTFAVVGTSSKPTDGDPGTLWLGGPGDQWPKPPPLAITGETLEAYAARHAPTTIGTPPTTSM
jgi:hypothetical protein